MSPRVGSGGIAGAISRTCVAPLERVKILFQVQGLSAAGKPLRHTTIMGSLKDMYRKEGIRGLWKGNGANVYRIVPMSGIQFLAYDTYKDLLFPGTAEISPVQRLQAGGLAGATAQLCTYVTRVLACPLHWPLLSIDTMLMRAPFPAPIDTRWI